MTLRAAPAPPRLEVSLVERLLDAQAVESARAEMEVRRTETLASTSLPLVEQPRRALDDYYANRRASDVSRMLAAAARLRELVDRVVIVGSEGTLAAVRAVLQACLHPYHNELSRGARGGRPRVYFAGDGRDNDALHGLLEILESTDAQRNVPADAWAILAIHTEGDAPESDAVLRLLRARLTTAYSGDEQRAAENLCVVAGPGSSLANLGEKCLSQFATADGLAGPWSIFTAAALLPAAVVGIDIVRLLVGGAAASERFAGGDACPARELAAHRRALANSGATRRTLTTALRALQGFCAWHDRLAPAIHGGDTPASAGAAQRLVVTAARPRCDTLGLASASSASAAPSREPWIGLELPAPDEASLGQLAQTLLLATLLEQLPPG